MNMEFSTGPALLFCPADRPDRFIKAAARSDAVILDLEDAVASEDRVGARREILSRLSDHGKFHGLEPDRTIVRISGVGTEDFEKDLQWLALTPYRTIMLAKTENAAQTRVLEGYRVVALCETAAGVANANAIAAEPNVVAVMWGAEDLLASIGGTSSRHPNGSYRDVAVQARSSVLIAAAAAGKPAIDSVYLDIFDFDGLALEAGDAAASGFGFKACIHPNQVDVVRAAYAPSGTEVLAAQRILEAAATAENGVFRLDGKMIDGPILKHAEATLHRFKQTQTTEQDISS